MNATEINARLFTDNSKYIGEIVNGCEIIGYCNERKQFLLQCTKCGSFLVRSRATVTLEKAKCECSKCKSERHTDGYGNTKLKSVYMNMLDRCNNPNNHAYKDYGGRGVKVCRTWETDFRKFYDWAIRGGYKEGMTLDRINNNGWYAPDNCRWTDKKEQANNRRTNVIVIFNNETFTVSQLAEKLGVPYQTLYSKIKRGKFNECE